MENSVALRKLVKVTETKLNIACSRKDEGMN
jgi:hypothetical protein